ncbi:hypothetical protein JVU11DRAFT_8502 [Chiua virens]|nr:hypothetical protein JVU11DRAFT_8502 [Chiua virens]
MECQWKYSFNYVKGVARTDGEAPERAWSTLNPVASSTKEMGPGHRRDTLDDLIGDSNWKKFIGMGTTILRKLIEAIPERNEHQEDLEEFEHSLAGQYGGQLAKWREQVEAWEEDASQPNPFEIKSNSITQASIQLQLAKDEVIEAAASDVPPTHTDISPSVLISSGLELEEQQQRLRNDIEELGLRGTDQQNAKLQQRSNGLRNRIDAWGAVQTLYILAVASL